jgi:predicted dehydrogenase
MTPDVTPGSARIPGPQQAPGAPVRPRLGFLGVGWIGLHRMGAILESGAADALAVADSAAAAAAAAAARAPGCAVAASLDELLALGPDGIVIATPSALHADQAVRALERGVAVFCQKPLGRDAAEARRVVDAARAADRLLAVDLSYRHVTGMDEVRRLVQDGALGRVHAVDLVFHNAYGPDKPWFLDARLSGGGCVMDLGIHLVDLALWVLGFPEVKDVVATLRARGERIRGRSGGKVEDFAAAQIEVAGDATLRLACSWWLSAGQDCVLEASFYGTSGAASLRNVNGSFYDFVIERFQGTRRERIAGPPDAWGGRAAVAWARRLAEGRRHDPEVERIVQVHAALDRFYGPASA